MTPEALNAVKKRIIAAFADSIKAIPERVGQLDGCDVFAIHYDIPIDKDDDSPLLLGWPIYAFVDPKHPNDIVYKSDVFFGIARRLKEAKSKANKP